MAAALGRIERPAHRDRRDLSADGLRRSRNSALVEWVKPDATKTKGTKEAAAGKPVGATSTHTPYFWAGFIHTGL